MLGCLLWWGDVVCDAVDDDAAAAASKIDWTLAVEDVTWVIEDMVKNVYFTKSSGLRTVSRKARLVASTSELI